MMLKFIILLFAFSAAFATPTCGKNEVYNTCGSIKRKTCNLRDPDTDKMCHAVCECKPDHVYENGECIPTSECRKHCKENEEFVECGRLCEPLCRWPDRKPCGDCQKNMCVCKKGYLKDLDGSCSLKADCIDGDD